MTDPLEQTATAGSGAGTGSVFSPGATFDHYVIQRELGRGGMGIVYEALDTDLQRRVALKVLREGLAEEAQQRLLREARAMARLTHPNVVTVYEVGSASGRDFVAMEVIDGESVADWLREQPRAQRDVLDAFVAAGRGLAAAHAAGIVHRDFKPHNVLRSKSGRIAVTDFGLARDATDPLATTMPVGGATATSLTDSDLTVPGSVLGTPAYMAPEQWSGGRLTAATDQFAFCVALWEALAGERPYRGQTLEALREQVARGPASLDDTKLPRRLRAVLRRGLAPDAAKRWPTMDALLAQLAPRTSRVAIASIGGAAIAGVAVVVVMMSRTSSPADGCRAPAIEPPAGVELEAWSAQRALACAAPADAREPQLACLDRVLARLDAIARIGKLAPAIADDARALAVDPKVCGSPRRPSLPASYSDAAIAALAMRLGATVAPSEVDRARGAAASDPCVAMALAFFDGNDAEAAARRCGDDTALAVIAIDKFGDEAFGLDDAELVQHARDVQRTLEQAGKADLAWRIEQVKASAYHRRFRYDDALASFEAAIAAAPRRAAAGVVALEAETLVQRSRPADLALARKKIAEWRPIADEHDAPAVVEHLDWLDATAQWMQGDIAGAGPRLRALHERSPSMGLGTTRMTGTVVDAKGIPVAGATVVAGYAIMGDSESVATPMWSAQNMLRMFDLATTDETGTYVLDHAPSCLGVIVAQRGRERSRPIESTDGARLVLQPTVRVAGRVDLGGRIGTFLVSVTTMAGAIGSVSVSAPISAEGRFTLDGVPAGDAMIGVSEGGRTLTSHGTMQRIRIDAKRPPQDLALELPAGREVRVLVRATTFAGAPVFAVSGKFEGTVIQDLFRFAQQRQMATAGTEAITGTPPAEIARAYRPGDLLATFTSAPTGVATVCTLRPMQGCEPKVPIACAHLAANAAVVTIE